MYSPNTYAVEYFEMKSLVFFAIPGFFFAKWSGFF